MNELLWALAVQLVGGKGLVHHGSGWHRQQWYARCISSHRGGLGQYRSRLLSVGRFMVEEARCGRRGL